MKNKSVISRKALGELQIGDRVTRMLAGVTPIPMIVTNITHDLITAKEDRSKIEKPTFEQLKEAALRAGIPEEIINRIIKDDDHIEPTWDFSPFTGLEVDDDIPTIVSYLTT